ncbi:MAG: acylphosphatase [Euryarchaeota archaeon]|nr:acylphosphatase [Euryarchaeota archaeon]
METASRRFKVNVTGRVQDIGFRDFAEKLANFLGLKGYIFNDLDGSVKMVLEGDTSSIDSFLEDIETKSKNIGVELIHLEKHEVSTDFYLPPKFIKIPSTEYEELGRKLDKGIGLLRDIKGDTSTLHDIKNILKDIAEKT